jgi:hypothetical protein
MNTPHHPESSAAKAVPAEPMNGAAFVHTLLILGALGIAVYKVLDAALKLL